MRDKTTQNKLTNTILNHISKKERVILYNGIPEIMTFKECCQLLKVGKNTLLNLIHDNQISAFKIGNRWKIKKEDLVEFIRFR